MNITTNTELLQGRYELIRELGRGGQGHTYLARNTDTKRLVAIKELILETADSWKAIELFEREGQALKSLDHPAIPSYIEAFHSTQTDQARERFFLVQEFIEGISLEKMLEDKMRFNEQEIRQFLTGMLEILIYLQGLHPPVLHRDIKPSNIIRRPNGQFALIDFGAVQTEIMTTHGGSTVVGTTGYMPLEQLMGRAVGASDLYGLAATAVHLLSHRHPSDLPVENMAMMFQPYVNISPSLTRFLEKMLTPYVEDAFASALEAYNALAQPIESRHISFHLPVPNDKTSQSLAKTVEENHLSPRDKELSGRVQKPQKCRSFVRIDDDEFYALLVPEPYQQLLFGAVTLFFFSGCIYTIIIKLFGSSQTYYPPIALSIIPSLVGLLMLWLTVQSRVKVPVKIQDGILSYGKPTSTEYRELNASQIRSISIHAGSSDNIEPSIVIDDSRNSFEFSTFVPYQEQRYVAGELWDYLQTRFPENNMEM